MYDLCKKKTIYFLVQVSKILKYISFIYAEDILPYLNVLSLIAFASIYLLMYLNLSVKYLQNCCIKIQLNRERTTLVSLLRSTDISYYAKYSILCFTLTIEAPGYYAYIYHMYTYLQKSSFAIFSQNCLSRYPLNWTTLSLLYWYVSKKKCKLVCRPNEIIMLLY